MKNHNSKPASQNPYCLSLNSQLTSPKGFTLVELLIVIGVLGVLATGLLIAINPAQQLAKARDADRIAAVKQMSTAINRYMVTQGRPPPNKSPGSAYWSSSANFLDELVNLGELKNIPKDPKNGRFGYYDYGKGSVAGAIVVTTLESIPNTTVEPDGSCRPFTNNWCSSTIASKYYCVCNPY
jgi:prepilin-type N-terminal cleavage/methylation domain-containing protein